MYADLPEATDVGFVVLACTFIFCMVFFPLTIFCCFVRQLTALVKNDNAFVCSRYYHALTRNRTAKRVRFDKDC